MIVGSGMDDEGGAIVIAQGGEIGAIGDKFHSGGTIGVGVDVRGVAAFGTGGIEQAVAALELADMTAGEFEDADVRTVADLMQVKPVPAGGERARIEVDPYDEAMGAVGEVHCADLCALCADDIRCGGGD